jgi:hypothetical protein
MIHVYFFFSWPLFDRFDLSDLLVIRVTNMGQIIFTSPSEGRHAVNFPSRKIRRLRSGANPRSCVPEASMQTPRPPKPLHWIIMNKETVWLTAQWMPKERQRFLKDWFTKHCFRMMPNECRKWILPKELTKNDDWSLGTPTLATSVKKQCYIYIFILLAVLLIACVTVRRGTLSHLEQLVVALLWRF